SLAQGGPAVDRQTRYDMASLTKILSPTMLALRALEQGELTLYDTVGMYFPEAPEDKRGITIRQLMTHSAGFTPSYYLSEEADEPERALAALLAHPLEYAPGTDVRYSCMGYILLGKLLEKLCGQSLDVLAEERVFAPLGMRHTGYCPQGENIAATEVCPQTGRAWQGVVHDENARFLRGVSANAGVFSCIDDMITFASMLARGGEGFLSPAVLEKAVQCHARTDDVRRGLGFHLAGTPLNFMGDLFPESSFGHTGFTGTSLAVDPETGFYLILLSNRVHPTRENNRLMRFRRVLHNAAYAQMRVPY
ncbi:MAG: serine hydrolase domain-containing protein, partial [Eubacteriales bacterium]|nr:serine hydrolase domain-containing protein [Eubacteriales bacterium]